MGPTSYPPGSDHGDPAWEPDRPVVIGGGGGGSDRSVDRDYWLWPLPPAGPLRVACQWLEQSIELSIQELQAQPFLEAVTRAQPIWSRNELSDTSPLPEGPATRSFAEAGARDTDH